jgi:hypothetical protein
VPAHLARIEIHFCDDPVGDRHEGVPDDVPLGLGIRGPAQQHGLAQPLLTLHLLLIKDYDVTTYRYHKTAGRHLGTCCNSLYIQKSKHG